MDEQRKKYLKNRINQCPFNLAHQISAVEVEPGKSTVQVVLTGDSLNIWSIPHGGILFAVADVAAGLCAQSTHDGKVVTVSSSVNFLQASQGNRLIATGLEIKSGRFTSFISVKVEDSTGAVVLVGQFIMHCS